MAAPAPPEEFTMPAEDETLGALLQTELARDPRVRFVGFRVDEGAGLRLRLGAAGDAEARALLRDAARRLRARFAALVLRPGPE